MFAENLIWLLPTLLSALLTAALLWLWRKVSNLQKQLTDQQQLTNQSQSAKDQAEAANQAKNRYLSGISHELRTPLNVIMGYAQLLERQSAPDDPNGRSYQLIRHNCQHLTHLIEGILEFSAIESGKLRVQSDVIEIRPMIDRLIQMFSNQAAQKNLNFHSQVAEQLPQHIKTDSKRLQQILTNLLSNAIKFTHQGSVSLTVNYRNQVATFIIKDTGTGIRPEDLQRIFQPFERVESSEYQVEGTGLGLTITQLLAELLGGELTVDSTWQQGSTFTFKIMLSAQPGKQLPKDQLNPKAVTEQQTILLVDDVAEHRELVRQLLTPLGFTILEAGDAAQALELINKHAINLALLDVAMPETNGWQLAQQIRDQGHEFVIIMLSANPRDNSPSQQNNHQAYLAKPLQLDALLNQLDQHLGLNWQPSARQQDQPAEEAGPVELRYKDRTHLLDLLDIGHINGIKACVNEWADNGKISQLDAQRLREPLERLNLTRFAQLLNHEH